MEDPWRKKEEKFALEKKEGINIKRCNYWKRASKDKRCESGKMSLCISPATLSPKWVVLGKMVTLFKGCWVSWLLILWLSLQPSHSSEGEVSWVLAVFVFFLSFSTPPPIPNSPHTRFKNCSGNRSFSSDFTHTWPLVTCWIVFVRLSVWEAFQNKSVISSMYLCSFESKGGKFSFFNYKKFQFWGF